MKWCGICSTIAFWTFTLISIKTNGWFKLEEHTYSKLGVPELSENFWIFWLGLLLGGALMITYGIWMMRSESKVQAVGGAYVALSGVFMMIIAPIHAGVESHDTLAFLTFMLFYSGSAIYGLGSESVVLRISQPLIFGIALFVIFADVFPSLGYLELFGISLVMADSLLVGIFSK